MHKSPKYVIISDSIFLNAKLNYTLKNLIIFSKAKIQVTVTIYNNPILKFFCPFLNISIYGIKN